MDEGLNIEYDSIGDILYVNKVRPYVGQDSTEIGYGTVARMHPSSGEVENLEILFFMERVKRGEHMSLPILASFRPLAKAV